MPKEILSTPSAPRAIGPYSIAVEANGFVFLSGQVAVDPATGERLDDDIGGQTERVLDNIALTLGDVGLGYDDVVKTTVFLADMADYPAVNEIYSRYFSRAPARSAIQAAALPGGFLIEIEVIAARPKEEQK